MNLHVGGTWTDTRVDRLRAGIAEKLTASQIAAELGTTRNAVLGKAHRMGLLMTRYTGPRTVRPRRTKEPFLALTKEKHSITSINPRRKNGTRKQVEVVECETLDLPPDQSEFACTIDELTSTRCRWPLSAPSHDMPYCGAEHGNAGPYCDRHHLLAYRAAPRR